MQLLEDVFSGYPLTLSSGEDANPNRGAPDVVSIWKGLPDYFREALARAGYNPADFRIYGGFGQVPFNWAKIPWVAICRKSVTSTTTLGYYVVLLFAQDMSGCYLSLNQGFTQYKAAFDKQGLALKQVQRCAAVCAEFLNVPPPFIGGPIDLKATHDMGKGYERGAIVSRFFTRKPAVEKSSFDSTLFDLMLMYDRLTTRVGGDILSFLPPLSEQHFQAAAVALTSDGDLPDLPAGPMPTPTALTGALGGRYKRNPTMAARAIRAAHYLCEVDSNHQTFTTRRQNRPFIEAHHLFPVSSQAQFSHSLDVPENIVALCPLCHRLLHHGAPTDVRPILKRLYGDREKGLASRGISGPLQQLYSIYLSTLDDDD